MAPLWSGMPDDAAVGRRTLILLSEPYSFPTEAFVRASNEQYPLLSVVGGMASAGGPGANRLVVQGETHVEGAVGILLPGGSRRRRRRLPGMSTRR